MNATIVCAIMYWIVTITLWVVLVSSTSDYKWQKQAIEHNAAYYDSETGEFMWVNVK